IKYARFAVPSRRIFGGRGHRSGITLVDYGEEEIPEGVVVRGVVEREDALVIALAKVAARAGYAFRSSGMVVSLPEEKSFLKLLQTPRVAEDAMAGAVRWAMEGQVPLAPDDMIYDFEEIHSHGGEIDHRDIVVTAFPKEIVLPYVRAIKAAGLTAAALELESQAIIRAVVRDLASPEAQIVLDMGRTRTSFTIVAGGAIIFTATIGIGGSVLEKNIATGLGVSEEEAIRIKKEIGLSKTSHDGKLYAALMPSLAAIADELNRTVAYYRDHVTHAHGAGDRINQILLSGGDAGLYGLDTYLAVATRVSVLLADPFAVLSQSKDRSIPVVPYHQALAFTAAMGLALRGMR
ncbi:MAG: pilus assembly protein PilM, partial [Candidatus Sungiibacteriota bacterium]